MPKKKEENYAERLVEEVTDDLLKQKIEANKLLEDVNNKVE